MGALRYLLLEQAGWPGAKAFKAPSNISLSQLRHMLPNSMARKVWMLLRLEDAHQLPTQSEAWFYLALMHRPAIARGDGGPGAATGENSFPLRWRLCRADLAANDARCYQEHCVIVGMVTNLGRHSGRAWGLECGWCCAS